MITQTPGDSSPNFTTERQLSFELQDARRELARIGLL